MSEFKYVSKRQTISKWRMYIHNYKQLEIMKNYVQQCYSGSSGKLKIFDQAGS